MPINGFFFFFLSVVWFFGFIGWKPIVVGYESPHGFFFFGLVGKSDQSQLVLEALR